MGDHKIIYYPNRGYPDIGVTDPRFQDDIVGLIFNHHEIKFILSDERIDINKAAKISKTYDRRLEMLHQEWRLAIDGDIYKLLEDSKYKLYRIMVTKQPINLRVIFAFFYFEGVEKIILLHAFKEESKADYCRAIAKAENRGEALVASGTVKWAE